MSLLAQGVDDYKFFDKMNLKQLKIKANEFLYSKPSTNLIDKRNAHILLDIIRYFQQCIEQKNQITPCLLILEQIFTELLRRRIMYIEIKPLKPKDNSEDSQFKEWLQEQYRDTFRLILMCFNLDKPSDSSQALVTAMRLLANEGKYPIEHNTVTTITTAAATANANNTVRLINGVATTTTTAATTTTTTTTPDSYYFPINRFRNILARLLSNDKLNTHLIERFREYSACSDVLFYAWKLLPGLTTKGPQSNAIYIQNYLKLMAALAIPIDFNDNERQQQQYLCSNTTLNDNNETINNNHQQPQQQPFLFDYSAMRKKLNKIWHCVILWEFSDQTKKQCLLLLLENIMPHLDKPVLLTDFLMDALNEGGPISLLALQGVFTLVQQHNLTCPDVYEKLYAMFEPEIFHTKFKARLFYLADIFLSSIALPEDLVAAFIKRLARLSLIAPPQDIIIILYFIGNLIIRHPGLKRLMCHGGGVGGGEVLNDPYIMEERIPTKSDASKSSLWEIAALQQHVFPEIAQAARFISNPLPSIEWDLANFLEINENDIFDQEIAKRSKQCAALNLERPHHQSMFMSKSDQFMQYWQFF